MKLSDLDVLIPARPPEVQLKPRWGTITALSPLRVKLDGDDTAVPVTPASLAPNLELGARVWTMLAGRQIIILGVWGGVPFPVPDKVTRLARSSDFDPGVLTWSAVPWQTEVMDEANAWTAGDPSKLYVPAGVTKARLTLYTAWTTTTATQGRYSIIVKNGNVLVVSSRRELYETGGSITSGWVPVSAGDWFSAEVWTGSAASILGSSSWGGPSWVEGEFRA